MTPPINLLRQTNKSVPKKRNDKDIDMIFDDKLEAVRFTDRSTSRFIEGDDDESLDSIFETLEREREELAQLI